MNENNNTVNDPMYRFTFVANLPLSAIPVYAAELAQSVGGCSNDDATLLELSMVLLDIEDDDEDALLDFAILSEPTDEDEDPVVTYRRGGVL